MAFEFLKARLEQRETQGLLRKRTCIQANKDGILEIDGKHYLNFASNDYLGLSQHVSVQQAYAEGLALYGSGSGASPVVTGYSAEHKALEDDLCSVLNKEAAVLFSSGFSANQAICHALFPSTGALNVKDSKSTNDSVQQILCDKYMHASFIQGALETQARLKRYKHNDIEHFGSLLNAIPQTSGVTNVAVATEGVFSMDGDTGKVAHIVDCIASYSAKNAAMHATQSTPKSSVYPWLIVDDAHAFGVLGNDGFGSLDLNIQDNDYVDPSKVDIVMGTFGKALGTSGAFVAGSSTLIDYMVNCSKHYVYSTAISGAQARATRASLALIEKGEERHSLLENIALFKTLAKEHELPLLPSSSAIQPLIVGDPVRAMNVSQSLANLGIWIPAIRTPTVPKNTDRLRITLSALHQPKDIHMLVDALCMVLHK